MRNKIDRLSLARIGALVFAFGLAACGNDSKKPDEDKNSFIEAPVEQLYNAGVDSMAREQYKNAVILFDEVDRQHPYSIWATKAELMSAYAQYQQNKYDDAISGFDRFIQLHPGNHDAGYAFYMKALCSYEQIADVGRDQGVTEKAIAALQDVVRRFPNTDYSRDAQLKLDLARDHLAGKEMEIGRYYQRQQQYVAAINRFRNVVEHYQTTTHVPEALLRLTECYLAIGIEPEAQTAAAVLGYNFPGSDWYQDTYQLLQAKNLTPEADPHSWMFRAFSSVF